MARFIEHLGLKAVILNEQVSSGMTIIEKFEAFSTSIGFAVVLLTPDDVGYPKDKPDTARPRARQNVIFELGYFVARLGRKRTSALVKGDIEVLSDFAGVIYIPMNNNEWKIALAKEMREAGIQFDQAKVLDA